MVGELNKFWVRREANLCQLGEVMIKYVILKSGKANLKSGTEGGALNKMVNTSLVLASIATKKVTYHVNAQTKQARLIVHQGDASNVARKGTSQENAQSKTDRMTELNLQAKATPFIAVTLALAQQKILFVLSSKILETSIQSGFHRVRTVVLVVFVTFNSDPQLKHRKR